MTKTHTILYIFGTSSWSHNDIATNAQNIQISTLSLASLTCSVIWLSIALCNTQPAVLSELSIANLNFRNCRRQLNPSKFGHIETLELLSCGPAVNDHLYCLDTEYRHFTTPLSQKCTHRCGLFVHWKNPAHHQLHQDYETGHNHICKCVTSFKIMEGFQLHFLDVHYVGQYLFKCLDTVGWWQGIRPVKIVHQQSPMVLLGRSSGDPD